MEITKPRLCGARLHLRRFEVITFKVKQDNSPRESHHGQLSLDVYWICKRLCIFTALETGLSEGESRKEPTSNAPAKHSSFLLPSTFFRHDRWSKIDLAFSQLSWTGADIEIKMQLQLDIMRLVSVNHGQQFDENEDTSKVCSHRTKTRRQVKHYLSHSQWTSKEYTRRLCLPIVSLSLTSGLEGTSAHCQ